MPDPSLYLKAMGSAAIVSGLILLVMLKVRRSANTGSLNAGSLNAGSLNAGSLNAGSLNAGSLNSACVLAMGLGLAIGYEVLSLRLAWPPANALDRFLTIVLPLALGIELISGLAGVPRWVAWSLRLSLTLAIPRILLHGSVYLSGSGDAWTWWQSGTALAVCVALLASVWSLLAWLAERSPGVSIPLALCLATQCAGLTVMMAGYIKGGAAAFPLAAALVATTVGARLMVHRADPPSSVAAPAILGIGVVGLFGLLFIGHFFGRLSTGGALAMLLAPLLCWATETSFLRHRKPWLVGSLRIGLVAIPLAVVLAAAKRDFDRDMAPLLGKVQVSCGHSVERMSGIGQGLVGLEPRTGSSYTVNASRLSVSRGAVPRSQAIVRSGVERETAPALARDFHDYKGAVPSWPQIRRFLGGG